MLEKFKLEVAHMGESVKQIVAELRLSFEKIYGDKLAGMMLFGSQARGMAEDGSDIDVLVILQGPVIPGLEIARTSSQRASISLKNNIVVSCTFISADQWATEQSPLLINIRRESLPA